jgi:putative transposase
MVNGQARRRSPVRLKEYDYSRPGAYFLTVCVNRHRCLFGEVSEDEVRLSDGGRIVWECWGDLPRHYPHVQTDAFVVMPNHVHGIIVLTRTNVRAGLRPAPTGSDVALHGLPEIVRALKSFSARRINELQRTPGAWIWQRGYYERVVRNEEELNRIRRYIADNPARWSDDKYHPSRAGSRR